MRYRTIRKKSLNWDFEIVHSQDSVQDKLNTELNLTNFQNKINLQHTLFTEFKAKAQWVKDIGDRDEITVNLETKKNTNGLSLHYLTFAN